MLPQSEDSSLASVDRVFLAEAPAYETFAFDAKVCAAFDDMVTRSVPAYWVIQDLITKLALEYALDGTIVDVGCATGNSLHGLLLSAERPLHYLGIDPSKDMLRRCHEKFSCVNHPHSVAFAEVDVTAAERLPAANVKVVLLVLTLQFIRPLLRPLVLETIHRSLEPGGCLLLIEKTLQEDAALNAKFIELYHQHKRAAGYSELEIARKREALENRLIPCFERENVELLRDAGFSSVTTFFQWLNFQGYLAIK